MVSFDKDGIFVDVSVPRFQQENLIARKKRNPIQSFLLEMVSFKNKRYQNCTSWNILKSDWEICSFQVLSNIFYIFVNKSCFQKKYNMKTL